MSGLALFFTRGVALETWAAIGSLNRECVVYQRLAGRLERVVFVTYGGSRDREIGRQLAGIDVVCNRWRLPTHWYLRCLSVPLVGRLRRVTVLKSNQIPGALEALRVARRRGKRFLARCGYFPSTKAVWLEGVDSPAARRLKAREHAVFQGADAGAVTTEAMRQQLVEEAGVSPSKVRVIPNFVDTELFRPTSGRRMPRRVIYVGRLEPEKNVSALVEAMSELDVDLHLLGSGSLETTIRQLPHGRARVHLHGNVANRELPGHLDQASIFVLPSHFEHHPKALLEAMAAGLAVVGTDVFGIRDLIRHGETGLICDTSAKGIRDAVSTLLEDTELRRVLGQRARQRMLDEFRFERVFELECGLLRELGLDV